jgi:hypothetical protein
MKQELFALDTCKQGNIFDGKDDYTFAVVG